MRIFSGRMLYVPSRPSTDSAPRPRSRFEVPTNPATNGVAGCSYTSTGVPTCSMRPSLKTAMRSLIVSASSWSWVTKTNVMPTSRWICFSSVCIVQAQLEVQRAERLVEQQHLGPG